MRSTIFLPAHRRARLLTCFWLLIVLSGAASERVMAQTKVVISQVYGGGGNSGATYKNDFIELFNPTPAAVTLTDYSVQYASGTSTGAFQVFALPGSVTLQAGQYYLLQAAAGSGGTTNLPAPDATIAAALGATSGKVALVSSQTALTGCPTSDQTVVDFVGFGGTTTAVTCSLGAPAPLLTNTTAAVRTNVCGPTNNNSTDFVAGPPVPHNSATAVVNCAGTTPTSTPLIAAGLATPASVYQGGSTLLTVGVTPATLPLSTGVTVSGDLEAIGGSATQPFYDDGSHGDLAAGDGTYSFLATVPGGLAAGSVSVTATAVDGQARTATASIAFTVAVPPPAVTIRAIQAAKPSAYVKQTVSTMGVVVSVTKTGFFLEAPDADTTPTTPEGIQVYTGSAPPATIAVGELVTVTGVVNGYPTSGPTPGTEIDAPQTYAVVQGSVALPMPIVITQAMDSPTGGITQFAKYEGMRVAIPSLTTTSGTDANLNEAAEMNTSNGRFYGVVTGVGRPFREPGISVLEAALPAGANVCPLTAPAPTCVPSFDGNPELIEIDSAATGATPIDLTSNTTVTNLVGVVDFSTGGPSVVLDKVNRPTVSGGLTATPVPAQSATEFTVASFNMERFYNDQADADNPGSSVVKVTTEAYQRRLAKASLAVRTILNSPDVIGAQEIENINVLTDLANKINADSGSASPGYVPYLFLATDGTGINTGMLVKSTRVNTVKAEQMGLSTTFTNAAGSQAVLNDRTPLVVHVGIKRAGMPDYPVTVISVHQRSLINVDDTTNTGATVRLKREAQAEYLATLIQGYQAAGEHVVTVGDYNAFEFSDGYVDSLGVTTGVPVPASQVLTTPKAGLANPALLDLVTLLPAAERQSYVENGSAQVLDHVVVTPDLAKLNTRFVYAHMDSDFPLVYLNDATRPERVSDHDPAVAYFMIPSPAVSVSGTTAAFGSQLITTSATKTVTVTNSGNDDLLVNGITVSGAGYTQTNNCGATVAAGANCTVTVTFAPTVTGTANGTVTVVSDATTSPTTVALTGSGGDVTITPANGSSVAVASGESAMFSFNVASLGGYSGTVTFGCSGTVQGEVCTVAPMSTTLPAGGTLTLPVTVSTMPQRIPKATGSGRAAGGAEPLAAFEGVAMAALLGCFRVRRFGAGSRRLGRLLTIFVAVGAIGLIGGCSGSSTKANPNGTPSGTQTITVTASTAGVTKTSTVTLIVR